jgi:hypothetical protein
MFRAGSSPIGPGRGMAVGKRGAAAGWSPLDEGDDVLLWVRADLGITAAAGRVSTWADQGPYGNDLTTIGATGTRPLATTWPAGNGQAALYWDGNDALATVGNILPTASGAGFTTFFVGSFDDTTFRCPLLTNASGGGVAFSQSGGGSGKIQRWKIGVVFDDDGNAVTTPLSVIMIDQVGATPASEMYVNGALVATTEPNGNVGTPSGKFYLGASATTNYHLGYTAESFVLDGRASLETIANWNAYTLARYGV